MSSDDLTYIINKKRIIFLFGIICVIMRIVFFIRIAKIAIFYLIITLAGANVSYSYMSSDDLTYIII
jgi:hypothetical protein